MSTETHGHQPHFEALVDHLFSFEADRIEEIASTYDAPDSDPRAIAKHWCAHPDGVLGVLDDRLSEDGWFAVEQLAFEHDLPMDISWLAESVRDQLHELGLIRVEPGSPDETWMPAGLAAILAPRLPGTRPTIPVLLGRSGDAVVERFVEQFNIPSRGTRIETILAVAEAFADPGLLDDILGRLPNLDWVGKALMTLELGGVCYWQEIFGHEMSARDQKVVPLMSSEERTEQRDIADHLVDLGLVFRIEEEDSEFAFIAVPEELWHGLWTLGQNWLLDWTALSIDGLSESGSNSKKSERVEPQPALKWLAVEAEAGRIQTRDLMPTDQTRERLAECSTVPARMWDALTCMGVELDLFDVRSDGTLRPTDLAHEQLEDTKGAFRTDVLHSWIIGAIGAHCDVSLSRAFGIDEQWRRQLLRLLASRGELPPAWLLEEGVAHEETGSGCLREIDGEISESVLLELGIVNAVLCGTKLRWLDLLSTLEPDRWYPVRGLIDLVEVIASFSLFAQVGHLIRDPGASFYFPMQRPSFFTLPQHDDAFDAWVRDLATELLEPLGLGELSSDGERMWLDTRELRVRSTDFWPDEPRLQFVRDVFDDTNLDFEIPDGDPSSTLRSVPTATAEADALLATDLTLTELLQALEGASATSFDGKRIRRR